MPEAVRRVARRAQRTRLFAPPTARTSEPLAAADLEEQAAAHVPASTVQQKVRLSAVQLI